MAARLGGRSYVLKVGSKTPKQDKGKGIKPKQEKGKGIKLQPQPTICPPKDPKRRRTLHPSQPQLPCADDDWRKGLVSKFCLQHEKSIEQWLFRAPAASSGGPGSKAFPYKGHVDKEQGEAAARKAASEWAILQCKTLGCEVPSKLYK